MGALRKVLVFSGLAVSGVVYFGKKKYNEAKNVLSQVKPQIIDIKNFSPGLNKSSLTLLIRLNNTTNYNFGFTTSSQLQLKAIRIYNRKNGVLLGSGKVNLFKLDLPAKGYYDLPPLNIDLKVGDTILFFIKHSNVLISNDTQAKIDLFSYEIDVQVFNSIHTLQA